MNDNGRTTTRCQAGAGIHNRGSGDPARKERRHPYAGKTDIPLEPQPIFSRPKGSKPEVIIWALVTTRRRQDI